MKKIMWWALKYFELGFEIKLNFVFPSLHYDEMERQKGPIRMLHSSLNRTSKTINHISITKLIKPKLVEKDCFPLIVEHLRNAFMLIV